MWCIHVCWYICVLSGQIGQLCVWYDSVMCAMTHSYVCHDSESILYSSANGDDGFWRARAGGYCEKHMVYVNLCCVVHTYLYENAYIYYTICIGGNYWEIYTIGVHTVALFVLVATVARIMWYTFMSISVYEGNTQLWIHVYAYIYIYMYIYIYACKYTYIYTYMYIYMHACIYTRTFMCICISSCIYMYTNSNVYIFIYVYMYTYIHVYMYMHIYTYVSMYTYMHVYIFIYMNTYIHIHACVIMSQTGLSCPLHTYEWAMSHM